jgi:undecaprenyl diphosphate synthase
VDERTFARHLYVPEVADADLVWRTSGEERLSNFMLWQAAYAEMVFSDVLWPDVDRLAFWAAIEEYAKRNRRYGQA